MEELRGGRAKANKYVTRFNLQPFMLRSSF